MARSPHVKVKIDWNRIQQNVVEITRQVRVPVWAVVKADGYGLGAARVAECVADLVAGFCTFTLEEARSAKLWERHRKPALVLGPPPVGIAAEVYATHHIRPTVTTVEQAEGLQRARPTVAVDTGMQRFTCGDDDVDRVIKAGDCQEAWTHATRLEHAIALRDQLCGRGLTLHAASSGLLGEPSATLDLVRPGLAIYIGAVRVSTPLVEVTETRGPAGYTGFTARRHGVIRAGYAHGLRVGRCLVNGEMTRLLEVGMQSAYVDLSSPARVGDEVVLLGDTLTERQIADDWRCTPHEVMIRLARSGIEG